MRSRRVRLLCALWLACAAGAVYPARAQDKAKAFDPSMSLAETVAWLGKQLGRSWTVTSDDGRFRSNKVTRVVKAEGCTLSYSVETQNEGAEPGLTAHRTRELWTVDLSGLDPRTIRVSAPGRVLFTSAGTKRDVIRTGVLRQPSDNTARHNRRVGALMVDEKKAAEVVEGLKHAAALCRR